VLPAVAALSVPQQQQQPVGVTAAPDILPHTLTIPPSDARSNVLEQFLAQPVVQQRFSDAATAHSQTLTDWDHANTALSKFIATCTENSPAVSLPRNLRWKLISNARLTTVVGNDNFYNAEMAELKQIEKEASDRAYHVLKTAKEKHVAHLRKKADVPPFIARSTEEFRAFVTSYAAEFDKLHGSAPSSEAAAAASSSASINSRFPSEAAIAEFQKQLSHQINKSTLERATHAMAEADRKARAAAADTDAMQDVLAGAHTGETIEKIVSRRVAPIQQKVQQLQHQRPRGAAQHHAGAAAAASNPPRTSGHKHRRDSTARVVDADAFADTAHPGKSVQRNGQRVSVTFAPGNHAGRTSFSSKTARGHHQQPKNGEGGDRSHRGGKGKERN
jgi:hypothetical protein